ncbi:hypothetical protein BASA60_003658 [Batrachochytrium salamandrivorans]|nr:hypothetical protein BASA60_003658 [Batrachochytrium salamandrivorans]
MSFTPQTPTSHHVIHATYAHFVLSTNLLDLPPFNAHFVDIKGTPFHLTFTLHRVNTIKHYYTTSGLLLVFLVFWSSLFSALSKYPCCSLNSSSAIFKSATTTS